MLDYLSILKMHYLQELSFREIGASVGCGKTAVGRFITRFEESELTFPLPPDYSNEQIESVLYKKRGGTKTEFEEPDCEKIFKDMAKKGQTLQRLWNQYKSIKEFAPYSFSHEALKLSKSKGYSNFIITNQSGIAKGKISLEEYNVAKEKILSDFNKEEVLVTEMLCCPHSSSDNCSCKKPKTGLVFQCVEKYNLNISDCTIIGDMGKNEIIMAHNAGCKGILVLTGAGRGSLNEFRSTWSNYGADFIAENALEAIKN